MDAEYLPTALANLRKAADPNGTGDWIGRRSAAVLLAELERLQAQRAAFLASCEQAMTADPGGGGRGMTARAARLYFEDPQTSNPGAGCPKSPDRPQPPDTAGSEAPPG